MRHDDDLIVRLFCTGMPERKRIIPWSDRNLIAVRKFVVQCSSKIKIFCFISCSCTHKHSSLEIEVCVIFRQEAVVNDMAAFVFETIVISVFWFISKTDQTVKFVVVYFFCDNVL